MAHGLPFSKARSPSFRALELDFRNANGIPWSAAAVVGAVVESDTVPPPPPPARKADTYRA